MSSLPSSASISFGTLPLFGKTFGAHPFPLLVTPKIETNVEAKNDLCTWLADNQSLVDDLLRSHGGLLFRNFFGLATAQDMNDVVVSSQLKGMDYIGGAGLWRVFSLLSMIFRIYINCVLSGLISLSFSYTSSHHCLVFSRQYPCQPSGPNSRSECSLPTRVLPAKTSPSTTRWPKCRLLPPTSSSSANR